MSMDDEIIRMLSGRLERETDRLMSSACTSSTSTAESLSMDKMRERIQHVVDVLGEFDRRAAEVDRTIQFAETVAGQALKPYQRDLMRWVGLPILENPLATNQVPARAHKRRRNQTEAYHRRVQKKWLKRFGTKSVPGAYLMDARFAMPWAAPGRIVVCHPEIAKLLREQMRRRL